MTLSYNQTMLGAYKVGTRCSRLLGKDKRLSLFSLVLQGMVRQLNDAVCHGVVALRRAGWKQRAIAGQYRITQGEVSKILKRFRQRGVPTPVPRPGRPRLTTRRDDRQLRRLVLNGRTKSANVLRAEWQELTHVRVSRRLVNNRLVKAGFRAKRPLRKPKRTINHRQRRLQWARQHQNIQLGHWQHVIFSDESRFLLHRHDGRIRVRRQVHEAYNDDCILPRVQAGGGGLTVWAAFHSRGKTDLVVIDGNLNQHKYRTILEETLIPFARQTFAANFVFQDDNARPHRARMIDNFLETNEIQRLDWPAMSPDMNPIENLWAELTRQLDRLEQQPSTIPQLRVALDTAWRAIPVQTLENLVNSMPRRVQALINARGGNTKY